MKELIELVTAAQPVQALAAVMLVVGVAWAVAWGVVQAVRAICKLWSGGLDVSHASADRRQR